MHIKASSRPCRHDLPMVMDLGAGSWNFRNCNKGGRKMRSHEVGVQNFCRIVMVIALALVCAGNAAAQKNGELTRATALNEQVLQLYGQGRYAEAIPLARECWRSARRRSDPTTPMSPPASTTWRCCTTTRAATPRPSRSTSAPGDPREGARTRPPRRRHQPQQPGGAVPRPGPLRRGRAALPARAWRSARRRSDPTTPTSPPASTTWRRCTTPRAATPRPSRSIKRAWRSARRRSAPTTPTSPPASTTWRRCTAAQGRYAEAEPLYQRAWRSARRRSAPTTPTSPPASTTWRSCTSDQGRYAEAEPLYKRSLAICEKALGPDHPDVATSLNNLAELYRAQGRYAEAEPLYKRALAIREKALGPDHPDVATSLNNLAVLYQRPGPLRRGRAALQARLAIREKALGPDHPDVAISLNNLAVLYRSQGRYAEAEPLYKRAWRSARRRSAPTTPTSPPASTTWRRCTRPGPVRRGRAALQARLAIDEKALGPDHPDVAISLNNLAVLYDTRAATPRPSRSTSAAWRSARRRSDPTTPTSPSASTTWRRCTATRAATPRPSRSTSAAWRSARRRSAPTTPTSPPASTTWRALYDNQGRYAEGLSFSRRAVAILGKRFGKETFARAGGNTERRSRRD